MFDFYRKVPEDLKQATQTGGLLNGSVSAWDVAVRANASLYYLLSATREDHPVGVSPGGIAANSNDSKF